MRFIIPRDPEARIRFAPIQSEAGKPYLDHFQLDKKEALNSLIFIEQGTMYRKSAAAVRIAHYLSFPWYLMGYVGSVVPQFIGDSCYDFVANHRYQWFGKSDTCILPSKSVKKRYLPGAETTLWTAEDIEETPDKEKSS